MNKLTIITVLIASTGLYLLTVNSFYGLLVIILAAWIQIYIEFKTNTINNTNQNK